MCKQEMRARELIAGRSTKDIVEQFELTEVINDRHIPTVRGWLMDELMKRDPEAFEKWMDSWDDSPRKYFLD